MKVNVYKQRWLLDFINEQVSNSHITNQYKLEERIHKRLERYLESVNGSHDHRGKLRKIVLEEIIEVSRSYRKERTDTFSSLSVESKDFGESLEFEPRDDLAVIDDRLLVNEIIARLATGDQEKVVLTEWSKGIKDSAIASTLARLFGGKEDTHARNIRRFRKKFRAQLSA